jgi:hypothetical protein
MFRIFLSGSTALRKCYVGNTFHYRPRCLVSIAVRKQGCIAVRVIRFGQKNIPLEAASTGSLGGAMPERDYVLNAFFCGKNPNCFISMVLKRGQ